MPAYKDEEKGTWYVSFHYNDGCRHARWCQIPLAEIGAFQTAIGKAQADNKSWLLLPKVQLKYNSSLLLKQ